MAEKVAGATPSEQRTLNRLSRTMRDQKVASSTRLSATRDWTRLADQIERRATMAAKKTVKKAAKPAKSAKKVPPKGAKKAAAPKKGAKATKAGAKPKGGAVSKKAGARGAPGPKSR